MSEVRRKRVLFSKLISQLVLWINEQPGWEACYDEVTVHTPRVGILNGKRLPVADGVHKSASFHHAGLAADLNLYVDGEYVSDGGHPAWRIVGRKWESLHPEATSGLRFKDSNHCSLGEGSRTEPL